MKSPGRLWNSCCMKPRRMSSIVFDRIGRKDSDTGRQFSFRYAFVLSSEIRKILFVNQGYHLKKLLDLIISISSQKSTPGYRAPPNQWFLNVTHQLFTCGLVSEYFLLLREVGGWSARISFIGQQNVPRASEFGVRSLIVSQNSVLPDWTYSQYNQIQSVHNVQNLYAFNRY